MIKNNQQPLKIKQFISNLINENNEIQDKEIIKQVQIDSRFKDKEIGTIQQLITKQRKELNNQNQSKVSKVGAELEETKIAIFNILKTNINLQYKQVEDYLIQQNKKYNSKRSLQRHISDIKQFIKENQNNDVQIIDFVKKMNKCSPITNLEIQEINDLIQKKYNGKKFKKNAFFQILQKETNLNLKNIKSSVIQRKLGHLYQQKQSKKNNNNNNINDNDNDSSSDDQYIQFEDNISTNQVQQYLDLENSSYYQSNLDQNITSEQKPQLEDIEQETTYDQNINNQIEQQQNQIQPQNSEIKEILFDNNSYLLNDQKQILFEEPYEIVPYFGSLASLNQNSFFQQQKNNSSFNLPI